MRIAGVVLAGGLSSRMGKDKTQLLLEHKSLLARSVELLQAAQIDSVFVSGDHPSYPAIADIYPQLGPLSGIHACVEALSLDFDALLFIPVDMPLLSIAECSSLLTQFSQFPQGVFYQQSIFPVILPINQSIKDYLSAIVSAEEKKARSLYRLFTTFNMQAISYSQEQAFRFQNTNTPEQWEYCLALHHRLNKA